MTGYEPMIDPCADDEPAPCSGPLPEWRPVVDPGVVPVGADGDGEEDIAW